MVAANRCARPACVVAAVVGCAAARRILPRVPALAGRRRGFPTADSFDGSFNFCRGMFDSDRARARRQGWWTDYPDADINFSIRLSELTKTRVSRQPDGEPNHLVVRLTDDALFQCPYIQMEDVGTARFSDDEVVRLREYLLKGGFLWVDDFWGTGRGTSGSRRSGASCRRRSIPIRTIRRRPRALPHDVRQVPKVPQIPSIDHWRRSGGDTSERGSESAVPQMSPSAIDTAGSWC